MIVRFLAAIGIVAGVTACGSGSAAPTAPPAAGSGTETFTGSTRITETGGCSSDRGHAFETGEGVLSIMLVESTGSVGVATQLCDPVADNHEVDCTIPPFARIGVGQTVSATVKGGRFQTLTVYPAGCGTSASEPTAPLTYTVRVVHPR